MSHSFCAQSVPQSGGSIAVTNWAPLDQSRAIKPDLLQPQRFVTTLEKPERFKQEMEETGFRSIEIRSVTKAFPVGTTAEFWRQHGQGQRTDTDDEKGTGWRVVAREGKACAGLAGRDTAYIERAVDFGCVVEGRGEVKKMQNRGLPPNLFRTTDFWSRSTSVEMVFVVVDC